ncbi:MAG: Ig-like domain-containing domain [Bacteroidota bacterium]|nr:Ig-like domain-containing domain [Bacteroidota bacterium]
MNIRNLLVFFAAVSLIYLFSIIGSSCAQIVAPTGGPRDSLPPVLLDASPPNRTTHFTGNRITLNFDEYIQLQNVQQSLLVSPTPKLNPDINYKLKVVSIKIRDTLEPNTTYSIDLGNAIQDINENNPYRNFKYVFSTGSYIDSLQFSGKLLLAQTGKADSTLIVMLYNNLDDSAVLKKKPKYIARLDSSGNFKFTNLAGGTYHVFGLKDESGQKYYNNKTELFAFADSPVVVNSHTNPVDLFAYAEEKPAVKTSSSGTKAADKKLTVTASLNNGLQDILTPLILTFNNKLKNFDSAKIKLTDTLFNPYKPALVALDSTGKKITIQHTWQENTDYRLIIPVDFATDTLGTALLKPDTLRFKTKKEGDYGILKFNFTNLKKFKNPVLQFVSNNEVVNSYPLPAAQLSIPLFNPGDYELRILDDTNGNGKWDPGNYELKKQPEKVYSISQKINIRANWENEKDIIL